MRVCTFEQALLRINAITSASHPFGAPHFSHARWIHLWIPCWKPNMLPKLSKSSEWANRTRKTFDSSSKIFQSASNVSAGDTKAVWGWSKSSRMTFRMLIKPLILLWRAIFCSNDVLRVSHILNFVLSGHCCPSRQKYLVHARSRKLHKQNVRQLMQ